MCLENNIAIEECAMAVVMCKGKILTTTEMIYGNSKLSLPKGHVEDNENALDASIRECYEETNILIDKSNLLAILPSYSYQFQTPSKKLIKKIITPYLFEAQDFGNPTCKEQRILSVEWMEIEKFLSLCKYESVKKLVNDALNFKND